MDVHQCIRYYCNSRKSHSTVSTMPTYTLVGSKSRHKWIVIVAWGRGVASESHYASGSTLDDSADCSDLILAATAIIMYV